jgi:peptide/nickel transport system substrate-binding protein
LVNNYSEQFLSTGVDNETHYYSPSFDRLFAQAQAETNPARAQELWNQVQTIQRDEGGAIVWAFPRNADGVNHRVRGYGEPGSGWLYTTDDDRVWRWGFA